MTVADALGVAVARATRHQPSARVPAAAADVRRRRRSTRDGHIRRLLAPIELYARPSRAGDLLAGGRRGPRRGIPTRRGRSRSSRPTRSRSRRSATRRASSRRRHARGALLRRHPASTASASSRPSATRTARARPSRSEAARRGSRSSPSRRSTRALRPSPRRSEEAPRTATSRRAPAQHPWPGRSRRPWSRRRSARRCTATTSALAGLGLDKPPATEAGGSAVAFLAVLGNGDDESAQEPARPGLAGGRRGERRRSVPAPAHGGRRCVSREARGRARAALALARDDGCRADGRRAAADQPLASPPSWRRSIPTGSGSTSSTRPRRRSSRRRRMPAAPPGAPAAAAARRTARRRGAYRRGRRGTQAARAIRSEAAWPGTCCCVSGCAKGSASSPPTIVDARRRLSDGVHPAR